MWSVFAITGDKSQRLQFIDKSLPDYDPLRYGEFSKLFSTAVIDGNFHDLHAFNMKDNTMNKKDAQEILNL